MSTISTRISVFYLDNFTNWNRQVGHHLQCECLTRRNHVSECSPASFRRVRILNGLVGFWWIPESSSVRLEMLQWWKFHCTRGWFIFVQVSYYQVLLSDLTGQPESIQRYRQLLWRHYSVSFFRLKNEQNLKNPISCQLWSGFEESLWRRHPVAPLKATISTQDDTISNLFNPNPYNLHLSGDIKISSRWQGGRGGWRPYPTGVSSPVTPLKATIST